MAKEFDLVKELTYETSVSQSRIKLHDKRSGEILEVVICHPGDEYPKTWLRKICEEYGFGLVSCDTEDTESGILEWNDIFSLLQMRRKSRNA